MYKNRVRSFLRGKIDLKTVLERVRNQFSEKTCFRDFFFSET